MENVQFARYGERMSFALMLGGIVFVVIAAASIVRAANPFAVQFPIPELGNCGSMDECRQYCDNPENGEACAAYAESRGLISKQKVAQAKALGAGGPGGCQGAAACKAYCDDPAHGEECLSFAEQNGFISKEEAARARQMIGKTGPGNCRGRECQRYCEDPAHADECIDFAEREGLITKEQANEARKYKEFLNERGPGGCRGEGECRNYCDDPAHLDECLDFGVKKGLMSAEEAARIRKISGNGPGGCKNKSECDAYCRAPEHGEECLAFAEENGLISKEEAERARKFINKIGPGGCRGEECRNYCDDPAHQDECIDFAVKEGMMPPEEAERAKKFAKATEVGGPGGCRGSQECGRYCSDPAHGEECFAFAKANGMIPPEEERRFEQSRELNKKIQESGGPGGCKNESECMQYCSDPSHVNECLDFAEKSGFMSREEAQKGLEQFRAQREFSERVRAARPEEFHPVGPGGFGPPQGGPGFGPGFGPGSGGFGPVGPGGFGPPQGGSGPSWFGGLSPGGPMSPAGFGGFGKSSAGGFSGPGGCASPEECIDFCAKPENRGVCIDVFRRGMNPPPQSEARPPEFRGPGGCKGFEECGAYCQDPSHADECGRFTPQGAPQLQIPQGMPIPQGIPMPPGMEGYAPRDGEFRGQPGEFPGRSGEFPGGEGFGTGGQPGPRGTPFDGSIAPPANMNSERFMREFKEKVEHGEIQEGRFMQGGRPPGAEGFDFPAGPTGLPPRPIAPPADMTPQEFMKRVEEGQFPMPQPGGFVRPFEGQAPLPMPGGAGALQDGMMPPVPTMPLNIPMPSVAPAPAFVPPPMSAPAPIIEVAPSSPPPPPPTSGLKAQSFIGLLYAAIRGLIAK